MHKDAQLQPGATYGGLQSGLNQRHGGDEASYVLLLMPLPRAYRCGPVAGLGRHDQVGPINP